MNENQKFVEIELNQTMKSATTNVDRLEYVLGKGIEEVIIHYKGGEKDTVNIRWDSKSAIVFDVSKAILARG